LSENPEKPGKGWDAACNRVVTWGKFKDNKTGNVFYHFNTHFDHQGQVARAESAKLLLQKVDEISDVSNVIVTGDFNAGPNSAPYKILTDNKNKETGIKLVDAKMASASPHHGPGGTFTGFKLSNLIHNVQPIDYIFVTNNIKVLRHGTLSDTFNGRFPSDHFPVLAEVIIE
jgi:endonuclease/exonuclease/phosphatase family metal-dependent hydrolase